jgi:hypothetical protein
MKKLYSKNTAVIIITVIIILSACNKSSQSDPGVGNGSGTVQGVITDLNNSPIRQRNRYWRIGDCNHRCKWQIHPHQSAVQLRYCSGDSY